MGNYKSMIYNSEEELFEKVQNGKKSRKQESNLWNQDKMERGQTELKKRKKKKSNREKDY